MSNIIVKKLFEQVLGYTLENLANELINTTKKEENQIIVKNIDTNKKKVHKQEKTGPYGWAIQPDHQRFNLKKAIKLILEFDESELKDLV